MAIFSILLLMIGSCLCMGILVNVLMIQFFSNLPYLKPFWKSYLWDEYPVEFIGKDIELVPLAIWMNVDFALVWGQRFGKDVELLMDDDNRIYEIKYNPFIFPDWATNEDYENIGFEVVS